MQTAPDFDQVPGLLRVRSEVEVGVEDLARAQHGALGGLRLLHLHDHVGLGEDLGRGGDDARAGGLVGGVLGADAGAGIGLDHDLVAMGDQFDDALRGQADPVFVVLDFLGGPDDHLCILPRYPMTLGRDYSLISMVIAPKHAADWSKWW